MNNAAFLRNPRFRWSAIRLAEPSWVEPSDERNARPRCRLNIVSAISSALEDDSRDEADLEGSADRCEVPPCPRRRNAPQCLELVAQSFDVPLELSPVVEPSPALAIDMMDGRLEGMVLKDRRSTYRDGVGVGSWSVKDPRWFERESWRFEGRV